MNHSDKKDTIIERLQPQDIPEAAKVISYAMVRNPIKLALWDAQGEEQRRKTEQLVRTLDLGRAHSLAFIARHEGKIVGALNMVQWPHCKSSLLNGIKQFYKVIPAVRGAILRHIRFYSTLERYHPHKPHWHLGPIGVLPEMQGHGIGTRFIETYTKFLDQQDQAAYLETAASHAIRNRQRYGFKVMQEVDILGVHYFLMWRSPLQA